MREENFVDRIVQTVSDLPGLLRLKLVFADLINHENIVLLGKGALNYSKHRDHKSSSYGDFLAFCHTDHTEHKNHC